MRAYRVMQWLLRIACRVFFRQIEVVGRGELPAEGAVIFCGNHPNSLLDPILITAFCGRVVHFAAKDTLFDNPISRRALETMGAVPIKRRMDHGGAALDNQGAFDALIDVLGQGRAIGIFPEGISHDESQLAPLKTGAARIARAVKRRWPDLPVHLVPTGLSYLTRDRFRSSVLVQFGAPLEVDLEVAPEAAGATPDADADRAATHALTARLEQRLRALTINADSWDTIRVLDAVRRLYQPPDISLEDRVELSRRFNLVYPTVRDHPDAARLFERVRDYELRLSAVGISDEVLRDGLSARETLAHVIGHLTLLGFWAPLSLIGAPIHVPLGLLFKLLGKRVAPRSDVVASTKFLLGLGGVILVYAAITAIVVWRAGWLWGLVALAILPLSGRAFIHVLARIDALRHLAATTGRVLLLRREIAALRTERDALEPLIVAAVDRFRPDDMVPRFPRVAAPPAAAT